MPPANILLESAQRCGPASRLFTTGLLADVKISCPTDNTIDDGGKREVIPAHRSILAIQSTTFCAMFGNASWNEAKSGDHKIDDVNAHTMKSLIEFLYLGKRAVESSADVRDLFIAADKYDLVELKELCEKVLGDNVDVASAVDIALLADRHSAKSLRKRAIDFIKDNGEAISEQEGAINRLASNDQLLNDVFRVLAVAGGKTKEQTRTPPKRSHGHVSGNGKAARRRTGFD